MVLCLIRNYWWRSRGVLIEGMRLNALIGSWDFDAQEYWNVTLLDFDRLDMGGTNVLPLIRKYFSEIFPPSHIKLTNNSPNKDLKSVERP